MLQAVTPALREILTDEERGATSIRVIRQTSGQLISAMDDWPVLEADDVLDDGTLLDYRTFDDRGGSWMQGRETAAEMYERFRSELQDFVAGSKFGWGQWRP